MPNIDKISSIAAEQKSTAERVGTIALKPVRAALGMAANYAAKQEMLGHFVANKDLVAPALIDSVDYGSPARVKDTRQLEIQTVDFKPQGGSSQKVEGWVMPPKAGNPTIVFFGGSDFDRNKQSYKDSISLMANEAKAQGLGFAVFDYPNGVNEKMAKQFVPQLQKHLEQHGVSMDMQAYAGYSQGSFMATQAAANNQNAAGLHITSGFSSGRMAQKEGIDRGLAEMDMKPLASLIEKRQLTEIWDNIPAADEIGARRAGQPMDAKMPISAVYDLDEDFGKAGNRHMTPLIAALTRDDEGFKAQTSQGVGHLDMLMTGANMNGFQKFTADTKNYTANANRQIVEQTVAVVKPSVREMLSAVASHITDAAGVLKATITEKVDQLKLDRMEKQILKRADHLHDLKQAAQARGDIGTLAERKQELKELQKQYDPSAHPFGDQTQIAIADRIDELKSANKLDERIMKNEAKLEKIEGNKTTLETKIQTRADLKKNAQNQDAAPSFKLS